MSPEMTNKERQEAIIKICHEVTQDILRNRKRLTDQCIYGSEELRKRARRVGIKLKIQGGLWMKSTEHNWCIDPIDGSIYDPTAEQFLSGKNGLQTLVTMPLYTAVTTEEADLYMDLARSQGWTSRHTEGISQIAVGYDIYNGKVKILDEFKKFYPDLKHKVTDDRGDELKIAKNDCFYAIIRLGGIQFNLNAENVVNGRNNVAMTKPQLRSFVVFKNENSYSVQEINQRLYVTPSGKTGLITSRGTKVRGIKLSKAGKLYKTNFQEVGEWNSNNVKIEFKNTSVQDFHTLGMILKLEEMITEYKANHVEVEA
jgi:hypothetical protein